MKRFKDFIVERVEEEEEPYSVYKARIDLYDKNLKNVFEYIKNKSGEEFVDVNVWYKQFTEEFFFEFKITIYRETLGEWKTLDEKMDFLDKIKEKMSKVYNITKEIGLPIMSGSYDEDGGDHTIDFVIKDFDFVKYFADHSDFIDSLNSIKKYDL